MMAEKTVFIYSLRNPETDEVRYIGKTNNLKTRLRSHQKAASFGTLPVNRWVKKLQSVGMEPVLRIEKEVPESSWEDAEVELIAQHRSAGTRLLNVTNGGEGAASISFECSPHAFVVKRLIGRLNLAARRVRKSGNEKLSDFLKQTVVAWRAFAKKDPEAALAFVLEDKQIRQYVGV